MRVSESLRAFQDILEANRKRRLQYAEPPFNRDCLGLASDSQTATPRGTELQTLMPYAALRRPAKPRPREAEAEQGQRAGLGDSTILNIVGFHRVRRFIGEQCHLGKGRGVDHAKKNGERPHRQIAAGIRRAHGAAIG